jgi:REP element-mobilizing transposase RayT
MARALRPHIPGAPFHLTARLQGRAPLFLGMEQAVVNAIREEAAKSDGDLLAYVVMPNHLHIVFVQGSEPLGHFMQPMLRRLAIRVHARHRSEGHVFQRRFFSVPCLDPEYLRNSIMYVHLNAVRGKLCEQACDYRWGSHDDYAAASMWRRNGPGSGLRLFAHEPSDSPTSAAANYAAYLEWRVRMDALLRARSQDREPPVPLERPATSAGDVYWAERFGALCMPRAERQLPRRHTPDLRDLALRFVAECDPPFELGLLRSGLRSRPLVKVRREFIRRARDLGYRNRVIARFLRVSDVAVSKR